MSSFPDDIDEFRNVENLPGLVYTPSDLKTFFAEDYKNHSSAIINTQIKVKELEQLIDGGQGLLVVDNYSELPTDKPDGAVALVKYDIQDYKPDGDFVKEETYPLIYTRRIIDKSQFTPETNVTSMFASGSDAYMVNYYPDGVEVIETPHIQIYYQVRQDFRLWQTQFFYIWQDYSFNIFNRQFHLKKGWNKISTDLLFDEEYNMSLLAGDVLNYSVMDFADLKSDEENDAPFKILNKVFSETPFVCRPSGIYEKIDGDWQLIFSYQEINPKILEEPESE